MESSGKPEQVHISEETASFLGEAYYLDEGEEVFGNFKELLTFQSLFNYFIFS